MKKKISGVGNIPESLRTERKHKGQNVLLRLATGGLRVDVTLNRPNRLESYR